MKKNILFIFLASLLFFPKAASADKFFIKERLDIFERKILEADAIYSGKKSLFFVERDHYNSLPLNEVAELRASIEYMMEEFDSKIYPKMRAIFGEEQTPRDGKLKIVLHRMQGGVGGYTYDGDGETIYLSVNEVVNRMLAPAYLAHEFQHLITFNEKNSKRGLKEEQWLNEARSEYAPTLLGYNNNYKGSYLEKRVNEFLAHPSDALEDWQGRSVDHAAVNLFTHYLVDRFGEKILSEMMSQDSIGAQSINAALSSLGYKEIFSDVFRDWALAVYINGSLNGEEKFSYKTQNLSFANLHVLPTTAFRIYDNNSSGASFVIDNWSAQWHRFVPGAVGEETTLHIRVNSGQKEGLYYPYIISDFLGGTKVRMWDLKDGNVFSIDGFGKEVSSVVIAPIFASENDSASYSTGFTIEGFVSDSFASHFAEGALARVKGDSRVYIVKNSSKIGEVFMRWIQTPEIFNFYRHLNWNDIIEVKPEFFAQFKESFLIRRAGDYRVYEADRFGKKKWLDMTPADFEARGYSWEAVYEVNETEFNWYLGR